MKRKRTRSRRKKTTNDPEVQSTTQETSTSQPIEQVQDRDVPTPVAVPDDNVLHVH